MVMKQQYARCCAFFIVSQEYFYGLRNDLRAGDNEDFLLSAPIEDFLPCSTLAFLIPIFTRTSSSNWEINDKYELMDFVLPSFPP